MTDEEVREIKELVQAQEGKASAVPLDIARLAGAVPRLLADREEMQNRLTRLEHEQMNWIECAFNRDAEFNLQIDRLKQQLTEAREVIEGINPHHTEDCGCVLCEVSKNLFKEISEGGEMNDEIERKVKEAEKRGAEKVLEWLQTRKCLAHVDCVCGLQECVEGPFVVREYRKQLFKSEER